MPIYFRNLYFIKAPHENRSAVFLVYICSSLLHSFPKIVTIYRVGLFLKIVFSTDTLKRQKEGNSFHVLNLTSLKHISHYYYKNHDIQHTRINGFVTYWSSHFRSSSLFLNTTDLFIYRFHCFTLPGFFFRCISSPGSARKVIFCSELY